MATATIKRLKEVTFTLATATLCAVICASFDGSFLLYAQTRNMQNELLSRDFLRARVWKADKGLEALVRDWPAYKENQGFEDRKIVSSVYVNVLGVTFEAQYRVFKSDSFGEIVLLHKDDYNEKFCATLLATFGNRLGEATKLLDRSTSDKDGGFYHHSADWLIGQTRLQVDCSGVMMNGSYIPALAAVIYRHQDYLRPLEDLIYIECSSTKKYVGPLFMDRPVEQSAPMVIIIDPNGQSLRRRDKSFFLKTIKFVDDEIVASEETDKGKQEIRLDRRAGSYLWTIRTKPDVRNGLDIWGKCSRVESSRRF